MTSRLAGAILALTAAALLLGSIAGVPSAWWDGHPSMTTSGETKLLDAKTVHVGPLSATGCNTGGDGVCSDLNMPDAFSILGWVVAAPVAVLALCLIVLGVTTLRRLEQRKLFATGVMVLGAASLLTALLLMVHGAAPKTSVKITLPIGAGLYVFFVALAMAAAASVLSRRAFPKMELRPSRGALAPGLAAPPAAAGVDVGALLEDDRLRPSRPRMQAGEPLPGPAGTLGAPESPLFSGAPQLRPLYDAAPAQGGTSGYVPGTPPALPTRAPTPLPSAQVAATLGLPTPPPFDAPQPHGGAQPGHGLPPSHAMAEPRTKPASVAPPPTPRPPAPRTNPPSPPHTSLPPRTNPPSVAPPVANGALGGSPGAAMSMSPGGAGSTSAGAAPRTRAQSVPPPPGSISARLKASSVPPPVRPGATSASGGAPFQPTPPLSSSTSASGGAPFQPTPAGPRTALGVAIPAPTTPRTLAAAVVVPPPSSSATRLPMPAHIDDSEPFETIERPKEDIGDSTDANVELPRELGDAGDADESGDTRDRSAPSDTEQGPAVSLPRADSQAETRGVERQSMSEMATVARERVSAPSLDAGAGAGAGAAGAGVAGAGVAGAGAGAGDVSATDQSPVVPSSDAAAASASAAGAASASAKIPISTAPDSLPPPKQATASGPSPACPQCEAPMAWVEEHLRFYCKSCRMYF